MSSTGEVNPFGIVDYVVFSAMLAISALTGIYHAFAKGGQRTTSRFLVADRSMNGVPVAMSLVVSFLSPITILGMPAETFANGAQYSIYVLCLLWVFPVVTFILVPVFHGLKLTSAYEYMSLRFHFSLRIISSILFIVQTSFYMAVTLVGPALALEAVLGFEVWKTVVITAVICTFYTSIGGMRAVIWTDVFQFIIIVGSFVTIIVLGAIKAGGVNHVWEFNKENGHLNFMDTPFGVTTRLSAVSLAVGGGMNTFPLYISQTAVQRYAASKSLRQAKIAVFLNLPFQLIMLPMVYFTGLVLYAFYNNHMTPLMPPLNDTLLNYTYGTNMSSDVANYYTMPQSLSNFSVLSSNTSLATLPEGTGPRYVPDYTSADQIMVYFVSSQFGLIPGLQGLFVACIFAGTLSTMSSGLNALIAVTLSDMVRQWRKWRARMTGSEIYVNDARDTLLSKILTCIYGALTLGLAFVAQYMGPFVVISNTIFGTSGGPLLGVFSLGMFWKRSNWCGALVGMIVGFGCGLWVSAGAIMDRDSLEIYKLSFMWYCTFSWLITVILGIIVSEIYRYFAPAIKYEEVDPLLLATFLRPKGSPTERDTTEEEGMKLEHMKIPNGNCDRKVMHGEEEDIDEENHAKEYLL